MTTYPFEPPIDPNLSCRHCGDPIVATGVVHGPGPSLKGLRDYVWTHAHGSDVCRPTTTAEPWDAWRSTAAVEAREAGRRAAEDSLAVALGDD